jgi:hypothetical protein
MVVITLQTGHLSRERMQAWIAKTQVTDKSRVIGIDSHERR